MRELTVAVRRLRHNPSFFFAAVITLAVGVAASTALFAVVNATLLRPLPYPRAQDIYAVRTTMTDGRFTIGLVASEEMSELRRATDAIGASALVQRRDDTLLTDTTAQQVTSFGVSEEFFELFAVPMAAGRAFVADDFAAPQRSRVILSTKSWRTLFGASPDVVGRTIRFAGGSALVVGVAGASFDVPRDADLWFAQHNQDSIGHAFDAFVRFKPGRTPESISAAMPAMWNGLAKKYPDQARNRVFVMRPLLDAMVGDLRPVVLIAFAATGLLLLLAIVNVANLMLARGRARAREMAVRTALGATRWGIMRPLLTESLLIAMAATAVAIPLAAVAIRAIVLMGGQAFPRADGIELDPRVFLFSALVTIAAGVLVGLVPASAAAKVSLTEVVNDGGRGGLQGRATRRVLGAMIVVEVTLAIALVAGAGRLLLSMQHLLAIDPGFSAQGRLAIDVLLPLDPYGDPERTAAWSDEAERRLRAIGATSVVTASSLPFRHEWDSTTFVDITNRPTDPASRPNGRARAVSPGFFEALEMRIVAGRSFSRDDRRDGPPVVVVNRAWARKFLPGIDPLRERVNPGRFATRVDGKWVARDAEIIGVVEDVPYSDLTKAAEPTIYVSELQAMTLRRSLVITAGDGHPERLAPQIRIALNSLDANIPVEFEPLAQAISTSLVWPKLGLLLMATFGAAALVLAATGVFGVIAFVTAQRSGEMAVRLALGASQRQVFSLVVGHGARLAIQGAVLGLLLAWLTGRAMGSYVYQVSAGNWAVLAGSAAIVLLVSLAATVPSARRAATTQPARVLRS